MLSNSDLCLAFPERDRTNYTLYTPKKPDPQNLPSRPFLATTTNPQNRLKRSKKLKIVISQTKQINPYEPRKIEVTIDTLEDTVDGTWEDFTISILDSIEKLLNFEDYQEDDEKIISLQSHQRKNDQVLEDF